jgi:hypothetical protein
VYDLFQNKQDKELQNFNLFFENVKLFHLLSRPEPRVFMRMDFGVYAMWQVKVTSKHIHFSQV